MIPLVYEGDIKRMKDLMNKTKYQYETARKDLKGFIYNRLTTYSKAKDLMEMVVENRLKEVI